MRARLGRGDAAAERADPRVGCGMASSRRPCAAPSGKGPAGGRAIVAGAIDRILRDGGCSAGTISQILRNSMKSGPFANGAMRFAHADGSTGIAITKGECGETAVARSCDGATYNPFRRESQERLFSDSSEYSERSADDTLADGDFERLASRPKNVCCVGTSPKSLGESDCCPSGKMIAERDTANRPSCGKRSKNAYGDLAKSDGDHNPLTSRCNRPPMYSSVACQTASYGASGEAGGGGGGDEVRGSPAPSPSAKSVQDDAAAAPAPQSHKSYRPLCVLTFRWNYALHQLEPMGYHLVNMLLHSVVCLMYYRMCSLFLPEISSFVAAMLFAVHPIHTEAVTGVVGRAETLSSVFFLAAFIFYTKSTKRKRVTGWQPLVLSMLSVATAMLCKEQGITVTGICAIYELIVAQKLRILDLLSLARTALSGKGSLNVSWQSEATKRLSVLAATTVCLLAVRLQIMGSRLPVFTRFDNPASVAPTPVRQLSYHYLISVNMWLLLFPCDLCCDWTMGTVPLIESFLDPRNIATVLSYVALLLLAYAAIIVESRHQSVVIIMSLAFLVLPFLPASNMFFPVGFVVAERILYIPSMGLCMLVGYGWGLFAQKHGRKLAWFLLGVLLLVHGCKTYHRNMDWENEYTIFMAGLRVNPRNAKLFNNVGHALEKQERFEEALQYFQKAVSVQEDDIGAHINVGRTFNHLKMFKEAEDAYLQAKSLLPKAKPGESYQARIAPNHLNVFLNLANLIARNETRLEEADLLYRQAISMRADYTQAYINRGDILLKLNRTKEAQEVYERALFYDSNNPDIYYNLGVVFLEQGKASQALAYLDKALEFDPEHEQALLNSAILLQELGRAELRKVARERLLKLLRKDNTNERVYFNLGMLAMDDRDVAGAEHWFRQAVQLKDDFRSALFNLALLLADDHRPLEAAPFLNQLVKFHPDHIKGLILLGDIYINNIKDLDAAENCYKRILQLDPENVQGLHNLCVVYVERGNLRRAEACLVRAHRLAPHEDYVLRHLNIVRSRIQKLQIPQDSEGEEFEDFEQYEGNSDEKSVNDIVDKVYEEDNEEVDQKESDTSPQHHKNKLPPKGQSGASTAGNSQLPENTKHVKNRVDSSTGTSGHTVPQRTHTVEKKVVNEQVSRKTSSQLPGRGSSQAQVPQFNDRKYMSQADQRRNSGPSYTEFQEQQPNSKTLTSHHSALKQHSSS